MVGGRFFWWVFCFHLDSGGVMVALFLEFENVREMLKLI